MKMRSLLLACVGLSSLLVRSARAHEYPMYPVQVVLKVESGRMIADMKANSVYWIAEVFKTNSLPADSWPDQTRQKAENYINSHFVLQADGHALVGHLTDVRFIQPPWKILEDGTLQMRMEYPFSGGTMLSGTASFYSEHHAELVREHKGAVPPNEAQFVTFLDIPGRRGEHFELRPGRENYSLAIANAERTWAQKRVQSFVSGIWQALTEPDGVLLILALVCLLPSGIIGIVPAVATVGLGLAAGLMLGGRIAAPTGLGWAAAAIVGLTGLTPRILPVLWRPLCAAVAVVRGWLWAQAAVLALPDVVATRAAYIWFWVGGFIGAAAVSALAFVVVAADAQRRWLRIFPMGLLLLSVYQVLAARGVVR